MRNLKLPFIVSALCVVTFECTLFAQKPAIDTNLIGTLSRLEYPALSDDGNYAIYTVMNIPKDLNCLVAAATGNEWRREIAGIVQSSAKITADNNSVVFLKPGDTLGILNLKADEVKYIPGVKSYKIPTGENGGWIAYADGSETLHLLNQETGETKKITEVLGYYFSDKGRFLCFYQRIGQGQRSLRLLNLRNERESLLWTSATCMESYAPVFDDSHQQLSFLVKQLKGGQFQYETWYYNEGSQSAVNITGDTASQESGNLQVQNIRGFTFSGNGILLEFKKREEEIVKPDVNQVKVDIWSYRDSKLQSSKLSRFDDLYVQLAVWSIRERKMFFISRENEAAVEINGGYALVSKRNRDSDPSEIQWHPAAVRSVYLVSLNDGKRKLLMDSTRQLFSLSPGGKYVTYHDPNKKSLLCYNISTGITVNLTQSITTDWIPEGYDQVNKEDVIGRLASWVKNDEAILLYDKNDIWMVDPVGAKAPVNITNGYGKKAGIKFYLALDKYGYSPIDMNETLILSAYNLENNENGFYSKQINEFGDPEMLTMGPYCYYISDGTFFTMQPKKAGEAHAFIVQRQSTREFPNFYFTRDFRNFTPISDYHPEAGYNWVTSELFSFSLPDKTHLKGVLYKPENFDSQRKYPVIFYYYEKMSSGLNMYPTPELSSGPINIPWFVSRGYLVFTPDIYFKIGAPGKSALEVVMASAGVLSALPYVDSTKMGLSGFSFGGYLTNYIVTQTDRFAAACAASGASNLISQYGGIIQDNGSGREEFLVTGQYRMGCYLWERPDLYIENSPVFFTQNVKTPLLLMNNKEDRAVPYTEGLEMFTALRRLGRKTWLLQYEGEGHELFGKAAEDFTIRINQFFDHYLKGCSPPVWMTEGVKPKFKGILTGLQLDLSGNHP